MIFLAAPGLHVASESCRNKGVREVGKRLVRHMPALMLFFSYLERSVTGVLCETDTMLFFAQRHAPVGIWQVCIPLHVCVIQRKLKEFSLEDAYFYSQDTHRF